MREQAVWLMLGGSFEDVSPAERESRIARKQAATLEAAAAAKQVENDPTYIRTTRMIAKTDLLLREIDAVGKEPETVAAVVSPVKDPLGYLAKTEQKQKSRRVRAHVEVGSGRIWFDNATNEYVSDSGVRVSKRAIESARGPR